MAITDTLRRRALPAAVAALATAPTLANDANDPAPLWSWANTHFDARYRYEFVGPEQGEDANASTIRLRLNHRTGTVNGWSAFAELDHVAELGATDFNSGGGTSSADRARFPVVADPDGTDLNQAYINYASNDGWNLRVGRHRIVLDDQRFIGGVAWRQHEQTYDGATVNWKGAGGQSVHYSYISRVNRIFGPDSPAGEHEGDIHLFHATAGLGQGWRAMPFLYRIDNDDVAAFSTTTVGLRVDGNVPLGDDTLGVIVRTARQSDTNNNPTPFTASYYHAELAWKRSSGWRFDVGVESLGGDADVPGSAFRMPLATLHKFQGWADLFLATPAAGIDDWYVAGRYAKPGWTALVRVHDFSAQDGPDSYGREVDFAVTRKFGKNVNVLLKGAAFRSDTPVYPDIDRLWLQLVARY